MTHDFCGFKTKSALSDASGTFDAVTAETWQPLSARESGKPPGLREGVPAGLELPLRRWIMDASYDCSLSSILRLAVRLDLPLKLSGYTDEDLATAHSDRKLLADSQASYLLDVADGLLGMLPVPVVAVLSDVQLAGRVNKLDSRLRNMLNDSRSVYRLNARERRLERRVDPIASQLAEEALKATEGHRDAGDAARQLSEATGKVRALHPEADHAYSLAIKAVESAAHAVIEPNNRKATLGTMLGILDSNPTAFEVEIAGPGRAKGPIAPVTAMMRMLWQGQTNRHGSREAARKETPAEAEMAVQLASVLVLWFTTGKVRRR